MIPHGGNIPDGFKLLWKPISSGMADGIYIVQGDGDGEGPIEAKLFGGVWFSMPSPSTHPAIVLWFEPKKYTVLY